MTSTFTGFSEDDLKRLQSVDPLPVSDTVTQNPVKKLSRIGSKPPKSVPQYKSPHLQMESRDDTLDEISFEKCRLSLKATSKDDVTNNNDTEPTENVGIVEQVQLDKQSDEVNVGEEIDDDGSLSFQEVQLRKVSSDLAPDVVQSGINYNVDELAAHAAKLENLQLRQKLMEEQNKKRKEMLAKALADRTRQTTEEVMKLEKIKKELQVLDGQFSQDVAVLRKKIDQACVSYAEAEKHYLRVEKEFLQAKLSLQKEREKKELLTEHLCALITHNETRKAQKLELLMVQLVQNSDFDSVDKVSNQNITMDSSEHPVIVDGVDERTGKIVELNTNLS